MSLCRRLGSRLELQSFLSGIRSTRRSLHGQDTPTRSVTISPKYFSAPQDPAGLLDYVNKNGLVQNISQSDTNGSLQVDFFELEAANQFTEQCNSETSLNLQTQFNPISPKPNAPTICDVWQGHSRKVRFVPSTSANWTTEEVLREFAAFGPIAKVTSGNSRDAWFNISFYKFQDAVKVTRKFDSSWGTLQKVPARDVFTPNNYSQQMLVVSDFPMQPPSLFKLHAATRQYQVVHYHSDASNGILTLTFASEHQMLHFYETCKSPPKTQLLTTANVSIDPTSTPSLSFHKRLALRLGACRTIYLSQLPPEITANARNGNSRDRIKEDFARFGLVTHVGITNGNASVNFLSVLSAISALGALRKTKLTGRGPLSPYNDLKYSAFGKQGRMIHDLPLERQPSNAFDEASS
ncbi:hypothetical protein V5O48_007350 [Marasmius crinis-equi]|uniref:RRM domain-containing protein n=1 Tax=Marasmius crinis-equi TaxID=585013 RepID=A0ABR3FH59_9AGAR